MMYVDNPKMVYEGGISCGTKSVAYIGVELQCGNKQNGCSGMLGYRCGGML